MSPFTTTQLEAFLDEALPADQMAAIEQALREGDAALRNRITEINGRRDAGVHSLGAIWRGRRLTCPTREQLGSYLLEVLPADEADYLRFHLETIGCRACTANLADLESQQSSVETEAATGRRQKYFQSSVGRMPQK